MDDLERTKAFAVKRLVYITPLLVLGCAASVYPPMADAAMLAAVITAKAFVVDLFILHVRGGTSRR